MNSNEETADQQLSRLDPGLEGVDGVTPLAVVQPATITELSEALCAATRQRQAVVIRGAGTALGIGAQPVALHTVIDTTRLSAVVSHDVDNFTVTAQAGMPLGSLQEAVAAHGQFLALNPPSAGRATVGGIVAADRSGPWRLAYGGCKDVVLGMRLVLSDGRLLSFGGKTMKNVAGYDVHKLLIGSFGSLGAICEATFRLHSLPQDRRSMLSALATRSDAFSVAATVLQCRPAAVWVISPAATAALPAEFRRCGRGDWLVAADLLGDSPTLDAQEQRLGGTAGDGVRLGVSDSASFWRGAADLVSAQTPADVLLCHVSLPPAAIESWVEEADVVGDTDRGAIVACVGTGRAWVSAPVADHRAAAAMVERLRAAAIGLGGHLRVEAAPPELKRGLDVWGSAPAHLPLLREVKRLFDPAGILSPGRLIGGI